MSSPPSAKKAKTSHSTSNSNSSHHVASAAPPPSHRGVSLSLPLLEGLCQRPVTARKLVQNALTRLKAAQRIARWIVAKKRLRNKSGVVSYSFSSTTPNQTLLSSHWLWDAMQSASRAERHVAARLLLQGGCPCTICSSCSSSSSSASKPGLLSPHQEEFAQWQLQHVLCALWNQHVQVPSPIVPPAIPMEWMALLKHIVVGKMATEERIMAFCLGGIPWMTRSIWQLVIQLASRKDGPKPAQLQSLIGLVELCYSVLLVVFCDPTEATSSNKSNMAENTATTTDASTANQNKRSSPAAHRRSPSSGSGGGRNTGGNALAAGNRATLSPSAESYNKPDDITKSPAVAKRLALRRRVLKRLFWKPHTVEWSSEKNQEHPYHYHTDLSLSPLACLIGAFHIWKTSTDWPYPGPTADACLTMLRQLTDPSSTAKAISLAGITSATNASASVKKDGSGGNESAASAGGIGATGRSALRRKRPRSTTVSTVGAVEFTDPDDDDEEDALMEDAEQEADEDIADSDADYDVEVVVQDEDEHDHETNNDHDNDDDEDNDNEVHNDEDEEIDSDEASENGAEHNEGVENEENAGHINNNANSNDNHGDDDDDDDDDDDEGEIDDDDDDDDDDDMHDEIVLHDDDVARLEEGLLELNDGGDGGMDIDLEDFVGGGAAGRSELVMQSARSRLRSGDASSMADGNDNVDSSSSSPKSVVSEKEIEERKRLCLHASMQVLAVQHPPLHSISPTTNLGQVGSRNSSRATSPMPHYLKLASPAGFMSPGVAMSGQNALHQPKCFSLAAEQSLLESVMGIVRPAKKPVNTKMIMRRAPTQEEFFRGSLSRNPISLSMLKPSGGASAPSAPGELYEPTVRDLRQHIADDLQMSDSAELLELLVANRILGVNLKLRVVHQVLWKNHLMEHNHHSTSGSGSSSSALASFLAGGGGGAPSFFSSGSGLSMMFSSNLGGIGIGGRGVGAGGALSRSGGGGQPITAETPLAALPPLVVTYRLAGVDGEATEDTVAELADPDAPSDAMTAAELEQHMEKEYGITRIVTEGRGVFVLLRSIEHHIQEILRRIRRDDVSVMMEFGTSRSSSAIGENISRSKFKTQTPYPGLTLLRCCAKLPSNRKKLLQARAPTVLLRLLLDVLNALEDPQAKMSSDQRSHRNEKGSNPTAEILQELIEAMASDISTTAVATVSRDANATNEDKTNDTASTTDSVAAAAEGQDQDTTTLSLVLSSLESISLSPPLRNIIAKLLPFLTYGQADLSRELALNFSRHIDLFSLVDDDNKVEGNESNVRASPNESSTQEKENEQMRSPNHGGSAKSSVLMDAFVQASKTLPPNDVCNTLRLELINCGFIERLAVFITKDIPSSPPPWSAALWSREDTKLSSPGSSSKKRQALIKSWREFFHRQGIRTAFKMLIGLCKHHPPTQMFISQIGDSTDKAMLGDISFLQVCHWLEATSDSASNRVYISGLGLLAETLMDEVMVDNEGVAKKVNAFRRKTRLRKKEIAEERRSKALVNMSAFGPLAGGVSLDGSRKNDSTAIDSEARGQSSGGVRVSAASFFAPVLGLFRDNSAASTIDSSRNASVESAPSALSRNSPRSGSRERQRSSEDNKASPNPTALKRPAWMAEMENLEDEEGLLCAVCQEGRSLQPKELLGLYAYVKKVSIPVDQCGSRENIDGTTLLRVLPNSMPTSLVGTHAAEHWYPAGKGTGDELRDTQRSSFSLGSSISSRRNCYFTTTVSAGNAIHFSCHQRARQADRNHPKAPKSEWEGAILRNSRVNCNVILPLVSSRSSDVPLVAVDSALTEYQTAVNNLTGTAPKSMLWTVLHDIRFLLLRMAYGEFLNADCGGGSLASNSQLLMYQLMMADMFEKDAQIDAPETSQHARNLSAGFLAACSIVHAEDYAKESSAASSVMLRGIADSAPMAALTCILAHNNRDDYGSAAQSSDPNPQLKRRWVLGKEQFLRGLIICAGRRHALGIETSGCMSGRGGTSSAARGSSRLRSSSFTDWEMIDAPNETSTGNTTQATTVSSGAGRKAGRKRYLRPDIDDFGTSLRPMITLYAIFDTLSNFFSLSMKDTDIEENANKIVKMLEQCQRAKSIRELLVVCNADYLDHDEIIEDFQKGMIAA